MGEEIGGGGHEGSIERVGVVDGEHRDVNVGGDREWGMLKWVHQNGRSPELGVTKLVEEETHGGVVVFVGGHVSQLHILRLEPFFQLHHKSRPYPLSPNMRHNP